ncbi:ZPR1 zinc-finger domain-containing protein [Suillus placidus]|uniref:ZPR1 zinc-finger domain-containing protein n=1 Tax=Suillus placidus TaxID=48579 RepID=A0A9P6ZZ43_9AGAM|nr:ZPR1 zinc-finger domain-containing protein [Suillus placidus]
MLTSIPFFREVIVMSFRCEHCGHSNNEIKSAGKIRPEGTMYTVKVLNRGDLNRQLIRSEACTINILECQLVLPPSCGQLTTVEGLLGTLRIQGENAYAKIQEIIDDLKEIIADDEEEDEEEKDKLEKRERPFERGSSRTPSGNSFLEFVGSMSDLKWNMRTYKRSLGQLGLAPPAEDKEADADTLIISTNCDDCAYRDNEIKSGTAISELGKRITLKVYEELTEKVFTREILGSQTSTIELSFRSSELRKLKQVKNAETRIPFTLILDDPLANSHVQNLYAPHPDPNLEVVAYERTWQQNEDLGLNDMNMESYSGDDTKDGDIKTQMS